MALGRVEEDLAEAGAFRPNGGLTALACTGRGSGSVRPWSPEMSLGVGSFGGLALLARSGSHRPLMIGLMNSLASRSHLSLSQFFHSPFFHLSRSTPCSFSLSWMSLGIVKPPPPALP
ncbi:hypothetical protein SRIMM317S_00993 [Streptomyces rimosus subsp. rimosus]